MAQLFEKLSLAADRQSDPSWVVDSKMGSWRKSCEAQFNEHGWPHKKLEEWKYTNLTALTDANFDVDSSGSLGDISLLSGQKNLPKGVVWLPLHQLSDKQKEVARRLLYKETPEGTGFFAQVNNTLVNEVMVLWIDAHTSLEEPLVWEFSPGQDNIVYNPKVLVIVGENAEVSLLQRVHFERERECLVNTHFSLQMATRSRMTWCQDFCGQNSGFHTDSSNAFLSTNAQLKFFNLSQGLAMGRRDHNFVSEGPNVEVHLNGLYQLTGQQHVDNHTAIFHQYEGGVSHQLYKGLLDDQAHAVFNGKIYIAPKAQKVNSSQLNKNLLLSKRAMIDTKPELDIYADDVKATHGATVGQLNPEEVFYLQSRAISKSRAEELLARGFTEDIVHQVDSKVLREHLLGQLQKIER